MTNSMRNDYLLTTSMTMNEQYHILAGIVRVCEKDKSGNILQLYLQTDQFEKHIIENTKIAEKLLLLVDKRVFVKCRIFSVLHDPHLHINVKSFKIQKIK